MKKKNSNHFKFNKNAIFQYLPTNLINAITPLLEQYRENRSRDNLILIVSIILKKNIEDKDCSFHPLLVKYWKKVIGTHYSQYLFLLLEHGIIENKWILYEAADGTIFNVKGYRIHDSFLNEEINKILYNGSEAVTAECADNDYNGLKLLPTNGFDPSAITIKKVEAQHWIDKNMPKVFKKYMDIDYASGLPSTIKFKVKILKDNDQYRTYYMSIGKAHAIAKKNNKTLFYFKNQFIIANLKQYERLTLERLKHHYKWQILSYLPDRLNFYQNSNTLRVYNHLTSLPSSLLQFVRINGDYILQADLKCSQFTILGNLFNYYINHSGKELVKLFKKEPTKTFVSGLVTIFDKYHNQFPVKGYDNDYPQEDLYNSNNIYTFLEDTLLHDFYNMLKSNLKLPQRKYAKNIAFETLFSGLRESHYSIQLKQFYPIVMNIINEFKETHGYAKFSVGLQNVESEIFIDHIWKRVTDSGITSFTRHDSILFPIQKRTEVESIITDVFKHFDFVQKFEYEEFNADEIWQRTFDETNYLDSVEEDVEEAFFNATENNELHSIETIELEENDMEEDNIEQDYDEYLFEQIQQFIDSEDDFELPNKVREDYFGYISSETIGSLAYLDGIDQEIIDSLEYDYNHMNLDNSDQHFQDKTNEFITYLIERKDDYLYEDDENEDENTNDPDPEFE